MAEITTNQVWQEIDKQLFAVLGMVSARKEARTVGIVYMVRNRKLYIGSIKDAWKVRHVQQNPHVSMTIPIHKSIPLMPWIKIPSATITFAGIAQVHEPDEVDAQIVQDLFRGMDSSPETSKPFVIIEVEPVGDFVTFGVGVSLMGMRDIDNAGGRVPTI